MNNTERQKVAVVIPCFNEEKAIAKVVKGFPRHSLEHLGYDMDIIVVDNNSKDKTTEVAHEAGAYVIHEPKKGKGNAMRTGFQSVNDDVDYVVMLDGDDTYSPKEIIRMLEPLHSDFCDVVIGSRLGGKMTDDAMTFFNRTGNWIFSHMVRYVYRANVTDVLTGYFAWKKEVIDALYPHLVSQGFAIEMEMITKMAKMGCEIYSVPISYHPRSGETNLRPTPKDRLSGAIYRIAMLGVTPGAIEKIAKRDAMVQRNVSRVLRGLRAIKGFISATDKESLQPAA